MKRRRLRALWRSIPEPSAAILRGLAFGSLAYAAWWLLAAALLVLKTPSDALPWDIFWSRVENAVVPGLAGMLLWDLHSLSVHKRKMLAALAEAHRLLADAHYWRTTR